MKIFISWSGDHAKAVALQLRTFIKDMIHAAEPWMSDVDIEPGSLF